MEEHKLMYHKKRVDEWLAKNDCAPIYLEIGLINICNHECIFCGFDQERGRERLETVALLRTLDDMARLGVRSINYSGAGEPLLHKDFGLIVKGTKTAGIDVSFSTNGVLFTKEKAEESLPYVTWMRYSVDAATPETHAKVHRTSKRDFPRILKNIADSVSVKARNNYDVTLGVQFLLLEENAHETLDLTRICRDIGVDNIQIKPYTQHPTSQNRKHIDYQAQKFDELEKRLQELNTDKFRVISRIRREEIIEEEKKYQTCKACSFWAVINEKGQVVPCHIFYSDPEFVYGNIRENLFSEIWQGDKRKRVVKKLYGKEVGECGRLGCRGDGINKFLHRLEGGEIDLKSLSDNENVKHVNFI